MFEQKYSKLKELKEKNFYLRKKIKAAIYLELAVIIGSFISHFITNTNFYILIGITIIFILSLVYYIFSILRNNSSIGALYSDIDFLKYAAKRSADEDAEILKMVIEAHRKGTDTNYSEFELTEARETLSALKKKNLREKNKK